MGRDALQGALGVVLGLLVASCYYGGGGGGAVCGDGFCDPGETTACTDCAPVAVCTLEIENDINFVGATYTIFEISLRTAGAGSYGPNLLAQPLPYNFFVDLGNRTPGYYDLLAIDEDGDWYEAYDFYCPPNAIARWIVGALDCTTC